MVTRDAVANLIATTYVPDAIGQQVPRETAREVFVELGGVRQSEWFEAGRSGLKPQMVALIFVDDYQGETLIEVEGVRYGIYRTYPAKHDKLELYLERKGGV